MSPPALVMLAETLRITAPYACAALGGVWAERSGVVQIGLEGIEDFTQRRVVNAKKSP